MEVYVAFFSPQLGLDNFHQLANSLSHDSNQPGMMKANVEFGKMQVSFTCLRGSM